MLSSAMRVGMFALMLGVICSGAMAADKPAKKGKGKQAKQVPVALQLPKSIELTADQQEKIQAIQAEHMEAAKSLVQKTNDLMSEDHRLAREEILKQAKADGKSQKEVQEQLKALDSKLPAEIQAQLAAIRKETQELKMAFMKQASEVLTDDQKAALPTPKGKTADAPAKKKKKSDNN